MNEIDKRNAVFQILYEEFPHITSACSMVNKKEIEIILYASADILDLVYFFTTMKERGWVASDTIDWKNRNVHLIYIGHTK